MTEIGLLRVSPMRRWLALAMLFGLVILFGALAAQPGMDTGWRALIGLASIACLAMAFKFHRATSNDIILRDDGLFETDGTEIATLNNIVTVEKGMFAFKPSGGFGVTLHEARPNRWRPGLYWRAGRRVGVGGVTARHQGRMCAEALQALIDGKPLQ
ncbi:MAG: hypothetical protein ACU0DW_06105 [Shimia sp.]